MSHLNRQAIQNLIVVPGLVLAGAIMFGWAITGSKVAAQSTKEELKWTSGVPSIAYVRGTPAGGPHAEFLRFPAGYTIGAHIHTADVQGVVASGTLIIPLGDAETGPEFRQGSYYFVQGGQKHSMRCVSTTDCVLYLHQDTKFDLTPVK